MNRGLAIKIVVFLMIAALVLPAMLTKFEGCSPSTQSVETNGNKPTESKPAVQVNVPTVSGDSIFAFTAKQIAFGPRIPNTAAHTKCKTWIINKLKQYGATIEEQKFTVKAYNGVLLEGTNIIAKYNPGNLRRVMLASHWDTRPFADGEENEANKKKTFDSADDGASGVASLLEIARLLQKQPTDVGVDLVFFDLEDYGDENGGSETWCLGSQHWAKNKGNYNAHFGVLFDMTGAKNARFGKEGVSMEYASSATNNIWHIASELGYGNLFVNENDSQIIDDHVAVNLAGIPMVDIINRNGDGSFGAHHHTLADNLSILDKSTLQAVAQTVITAVYREQVQ